MSVFRNGKPQPKGRKGDVRGGWPDISKVPGDGDVIKPHYEGRPESHASHQADATQDIFGVGTAKQRAAPSARAGKIPSGGDV